MVRTRQQLIEVRDLLVQALEKIDALDDTFLGVVIDTALQDIKARIEGPRAKE